MRPLGKCPFSMSNGQQESWHRERVWVRYQKKDLPSASSSLNSIRLSVLQTADFSLPPHLKNICFMLFLIEDSYLIDPSPAACRLRWQREKKSIWIPQCIAVFQVYWIISFSLSVFSMVKGLPCVLTLNNSHVATAALPTVGSCVIQQRNQVRLLS